MRETFDLERRSGRQRWTTVAIERATGTVVAYTDLVSYRPPAIRANQWGTYVHRAHRGHSLGMAVKIANLAALQSDRPDLRSVTTNNDATNTYMIAVNERMGFRLVEAWLGMIDRV